jgi:hypothetical protein
MYDTDFGFGLYDWHTDDNTLEFATATGVQEWPNPEWSTFLLRKLLENESFKLNFINRTADLLNEELNSLRVDWYIDSLKAGLEPDAGMDPETEMARHTSRWGQSYSNWNSNIDFLHTYASARPAILRQHVINKFSLAGQVTVQLIASGGGKIKINSLSLGDFPWTGIYFKGVPIKLAAEPQPDYAFAGWQGDLVSANQEVTLTLQNAASIQAVFVETGMPVVINEINYNSSDDFNVEDWVEFYNRGTTTVDLSFWQFRDSDDIHNYIFPQGTILNPASYLVVCHNPALFKQGFPEVACFPESLTFGLSGGGESLFLLDDHGYMIDSLTYDDQVPWPPEADGDGPTLALKHPDLDNSLPGNWAVSAGHGTPGQLNDVYTNAGKEIIRIPRQFILEQNYPNPFNPATIISFQLPLGGVTALEIFDIQGRLISRLIERHLPAGEYQVEWQPDLSLASGIYFYRLELKNLFQVTKKMILLR